MTVYAVLDRPVFGAVDPACVPMFPTKDEAWQSVTALLDVYQDAGARWRIFPDGHIVVWCDPQDADSNRVIDVQRLTV